MTATPFFSFLLVTSMTDPSHDDMLESIFALQAALNDHVFQANALRDNDGNALTMAAIHDQVTAGRLMVNDLPNQWLSKYAKAMNEELGELQDELRWKWWSKDKIDLQNIRVELVDLLHFLVSALLCAGMTAEKVYDIYKQKHAVNLARQDSGYNQASKTEADNRGIQ